MAEINAKFDRVIMDCLNGDGMRGPSHFMHSTSHDKSRCVNDEHAKNFIYDCPSGRQLNQFITGHGPDDDLWAPPLMYFESNITGMAITVVSNDFTVAIFTTDDGYLHKYELLTLDQVRLLGSLQLVPDGKAITSLALDHTGTVAFVTSFQKVFRVELFNCSAYLTCESCLKAHDPYCGWCVAEGRCLLFHQCPSVEHFSSMSHGPDKKRSFNGYSGNEFSSSHPIVWLHYNISTNKCPIIMQVSPPGIQVSKNVVETNKDVEFNDDSYYHQQNIILSLDKLLQDNLPNSNFPDALFFKKQPHQMHYFGDLYHPLRSGGGSTIGTPLFCSFREAPPSFHQLEPLVSGTISSFDFNKILVGVTRTPLIARTAAKLSYNSGKPVEAHCLSPAPSQLPLLKDGEASLPIILWLEKVSMIDPNNEIIGALAPTIFSIYDCSQLRDCQSCTGSRFVCVWCIFEDRCVSGSSTLFWDGEVMDTVCKDSTHTTNSKSYEQINSPFGIIPAGRAEDCPRFKGSSQPITLTSGSPLVIRFHVLNVQQVVGFSCSENCTNQYVRGSYNASDSTVFCHIEMINLTAKFNTRSPNSLISDSRGAAVNCGLDLYWHGSNDRDSKGHRMVNEDQIHAEVYACEWLAEYCDECLLLPARFGCTWCVPSHENLPVYDFGSHSLKKAGDCRTRKSCLENRYFNGTTTLRQYPLRPGDICPNPEILSLTPANATLTGQPILTISGRNLGRSVSDIIDMFLDIQPKIRCLILPETYQRSHKFMCRLAAAPNLSLPVSSKLKVVISSERYEASSPVFRFLAPHLVHATPQRGPKAGGTRLYLSGTNLNTGSNRSVYLYLPAKSGVNGESDLNRLPASRVQVKCEIEQECQTLIICLTGSLPEEVINSILRKQSKRHITSMNVDHDKLFSEDEHIPLSLVMMHDLTPTYLPHSFSFIYSPNPTIHEVQRKNVLASGGTTLYVLGSFLFVVNDPRLVFYFNGSEYSISCSTSPGGYLECLSPSLVMSSDVSVSDAIVKSVYIHEGLDNSAVSNTSSWINQKQATTSHLPISESVMQSEFKLKPDVYYAAFSSSGSIWPIHVPYGFIMDGVRNLRVFGLIKVHQDPVVVPFADGIRIENLDDYLTSDSESETNNYGHKRQRSSQLLKSECKTSSSRNSDNLSSQLDYSNVKQLIRILGQFDALLHAPELSKPDELVVRIGDSLICEVNSIMLTEIRCDLDRRMLVTRQDYPVEIQFGRFLIYRPGSVRFVALRQAALRSQVIMIFISLILITIFVGLTGFAIWRRFIRHQKNYEAKLEEKYAEHENRVVRIFKEDFMELQTTQFTISRLSNLLFIFSFPEYHCELMNPVNPHSYFPLSTKFDTLRPPDDALVPHHPLLSPFTVYIQAHNDAAKGISLFHVLLCNHEHIMAKDKSRIASLLCIALQPKMDYLTSVMFDLMTNVLCQLHHEGDSHLATAFRRAETIVDKILSNWLTFLLYKFIKNSVGENLFYFYRALLQQINMGPCDAITGKARYTLDSSSLLHTELTGNQVILNVEDPQSLFGLPTPYICVKVLDCDTITQTKEKILDAIYKNKPYSKRIKSTQLELRRLYAQTTPQNPDNEIRIAQTLSDWDVKICSTSTEHETAPRRLNCVKDYQLTAITGKLFKNAPQKKMNFEESQSSTDFIERRITQCLFKGVDVLYTYLLFKRRRQDQRLFLPSSEKFLTVLILQLTERLKILNSVFIVSHTRVVRCFTFSNNSHKWLPTSVEMHSPTLARPLPPPVSSFSTTKPVKIGPEPPPKIKDFTSNVSVGVEQRHLPKVPVPSELSFCFRPTGVPDPKLCPVDTNGRVRRLTKSNRSLNKKSVNIQYLFCTCPREANYSQINDFAGDLKTCCSSTSDSHGNELTKMCSACVAHHPLLSSFGVNDPKNHHVPPINSKSKPSEKWKKYDSYNRSKHKKDFSEISTLKGETLPKEVFFNRLLLTRLSVTKYMDKLFEVIFSSVVQSHSLPAPIKYLFDFLDDRAFKLGVQDSKIVHAWKSNCIQMRFWNQIITNLDYIFDISLLRNTALERSFHSFSHAMTYAYISQQWNRVHNYYREIKALPAVQREAMDELLRQHSVNHSTDFNVSWAIFELYTKYVRNHQDMLIAHLQQHAINQSSSSYRTTSEQPIPSNCNSSEKPFVSACTEWNPVKFIQMLIEINQCLNNVETIQASFAQTNVTSFSTSFTTGDIYSACDSRTAPSQTVTDCLDTLRSYNTLTTEFAGDETSRSAHHYYYHHHYYHNHHNDGRQVNTTTEPADLSIHSTAALSANDTYAESVSKYKDPLA
ncbi:unnamed protein product [Heterobilharzia americana]|nr:unnamed protein product [Heterobilharzia americana]